MCRFSVNSRSQFVVVASEQEVQKRHLTIFFYLLGKQYVRVLSVKVFVKIVTPPYTKTELTIFTNRQWFWFCAVRGLTWVNKMKICGVWYSLMQTRIIGRLGQKNSSPSSTLGNLVPFPLLAKHLLLMFQEPVSFGFPLPKWVVSQYNKLVYPFVWGSKIETVSCKTLTLPFNEGGLSLVDLITECKALKVAATVSIAANSDTDDHYLQKHFIGSQLAHLGTECSHLRDNSTTSALTPTKFYDCILRAITDLNAQVHKQAAFTYSSKECYEAFLYKSEVTRPRLHWGWSSHVSSDFSMSQHRLGVCNYLTENFKNDLLYLITLRGAKVRDSLYSWG